MSLTTHHTGILCIFTTVFPFLRTGGEAASKRTRIHDRAMASALLPWLRDGGYTEWSLALGVLVAAAVFYSLMRPTSAVPSIAGTIPRLSVTLMYMTDMRKFLSKAKCIPSSIPPITSIDRSTD